ncbi:hypothetical protein FACS18948_1990 [Clostridia bacterium]|nr:hypothetical protein FACS18948_1990 [Clostridia bacterium]
MKKSVVITGGNSGLDYKTAINIAKQGANWDVLIACRSAKRAEKAVREASLPNITENGRIVYVASDMHESPRMFCKVIYSGAYDLAYPQKDIGMLSYSLSKLCNIYTVYELSRGLQDENRKITANAFNPGMMNDTGLSREATGFMTFANNRVAPLFARMQGRFGSSETSSAASAEMITAEKYQGMGGPCVGALTTNKIRKAGAI